MIKKNIQKRKLFLQRLTLILDKADGNRGNLFGKSHELASLFI
jgi:hypothetical protein